MTSPRWGLRSTGFGGAAMSEWKPKRFWKVATVTEVDGGFSIALDGRTLRTPAKAALILPTRALAEAIAGEWQAQEDELRPETMPLTRIANSAVDKVGPQQSEVAALLAAYAETDLLCHRAQAPEALVQRQSAAWDPLLDWAAAALEARLQPVAGVIAAPQDRRALDRLGARVGAFDPFELAAFHDLVTLTGSLILAFAVVGNVDDPETIWAASRIDETWQAEIWGTDEEAAENSEIKKQAFFDALRFFVALQSKQPEKAL